MREHEIDGAFIQRFTSSTLFDDRRSKERPAGDGDVPCTLKLPPCIRTHLVVMYDLSGMPAHEMGRVINDWKHLVDDLGIRNNRAYQFHRGKPLIAIGVWALTTSSLHAR